MDKQKNVDVFENDDKGDYVPPLDAREPGPEELPPLGSVESYPDRIIPKPKEKKMKVGTPKKITITFRHNRTFELHIGQEVMRFEGRVSLPIDRDLLDHPAFIQAKKYFIIKGI